MEFKPGDVIEDCNADLWKCVKKLRGKIVFIRIRDYTIEQAADSIPGPFRAILYPEFADVNVKVAGTGANELIINHERPASDVWKWWD